MLNIVKKKSTKSWWKRAWKRALEFQNTELHHIAAGCQGCVAKKTVKTLSFKIFKTLTESNDEIFARNSRKAYFFVWPKMEDDTFSEK